MVQLHLSGLRYTEAAICLPIAVTCRPSHRLLLQLQPAIVMRMLT